MKVDTFVSEIASLQVEHCFNPYLDRCLEFDLADAPRRRTAALLGMLTLASSEALDGLWIGRDLGYRGGRRTGLAFTDDVHLENHFKRWGLEAQRATHGEVVSERTASVIWDKLDRIDSRTFLWNVFPLHPHEPEISFSNRKHNARERRLGEEVLTTLIEILRPSRIVAVGTDAADVATRVAPGIPVFSVRHPSYGGQRQFLRQLDDLYGT